MRKDRSGCVRLFEQLKRAFIAQVFRWSLGPNYSWVVSPSLTPRVLRIFPCGLALQVRRAVRRMLPRPPVFFWLTRLSFPSRACVYFWLGSASIQDHQCVAAASANPHSSQGGRTNTSEYSITQSSAAAQKQNRSKQFNATLER